MNGIGACTQITSHIGGTRDSSNTDQRHLDPQAVGDLPYHLQLAHGRVASRPATDAAELTIELMGSQGLGWEGENFKDDELAIVREWLGGKAISIYGGSYEIQNNIISKNILGLPETTQKG